jgi:Txe/YoeB family toxin of Txe-Axe toxin-antitoxin module
MILLRQKQFTGRDDGFEGKKGDIKRSKFRRSPSYKKFGPWEVRFSDNAEDEYKEDLDEKQQRIVDKIMKELETKPFQGNYGQHPLWEFYDSMNECVVWSAEIDDENRLNYLIFKSINCILVINLVGHKVVDIEYAKQ